MRRAGGTWGIRREAEEFQGFGGGGTPSGRDSEVIERFAGVKAESHLF
jgi:hypothetical protein